MPTYLYRCASCGREVEQQHTMQQPIPERVNVLGHAHEVPERAESDAPLCAGVLQRVYSVPRLNTGWSTNPIEEFRHRHLK